MPASENARRVTATVPHSEAAMHSRLAGKTLVLVEEDRYVNGDPIPYAQRNGCYALDGGARVPLLKVEAGWKEPALRVLARDEEARVFRVPAIHPSAYTHPVAEGEYAAVCGGQNWSIYAPSRDELDHVLAWLLAQDVPMGRLKKHGSEDYLHEPTGVVIERGREPWENGKGATVTWHSTIDGVRVRWPMLSCARNLFQALADRPA